MNKEIKKILNEIDRIAKKGPDALLEFKEYVEYLLLNNKLNYYLDAIEKKYGFSPGGMANEKSFPLILIQTNTKLMDDIKSLYEKKGVYSISFDIHDLTTNVLIGSLKEFEEEVDGVVYINLIITNTNGDQLIVDDDEVKANVGLETYNKMSPDEIQLKKYEISIVFLQSFY